MEDLDCRYETATPDGFRWDDLASCPEALEAALSGDWSGVGDEPADEQAAA